MAFGEPFGCLKDGVFHSWVSLITQTIKAGAYEQATRRMFMSGSPMQRFLCQFIPKDLRLKRFQHLELSKEKCLKYVLRHSFTLHPADQTGASMRVFAVSTMTSSTTFSVRTRRAVCLKTRSS